MISTAVIQALLSGAAVGSVYALVALGFSITFSTTKTLNFSHGDFVSAGAFIYVTVLFLTSGEANLSVTQVSAGHWQELLGVAISLTGMAALGIVLYLIGVRPFAGKPGLSWVVSTIGFGIILQSVGLALWGSGTIIVPSPIGDGLVSIFGASIRRQELLVLIVALLMMIVLDVIMRRTTIGKIMKAVSHSPSVAGLMGINVTAVMLGSFALSSALAALSGLLIAPTATATIYLGLSFGLKGFSAAIVGGLTNPRGCIVSGFMLGMVEALVNLWQAQWRDVVIFAVVILVLVIRPNGLFSKYVAEKT